MPQRLLRNSTIKVAEALQYAIGEVASLRRNVLIPEFILLALIEQKDSIVLKILDELGHNTQKTRRELVDNIIELTSLDSGSKTDTIPFNMKISNEVVLLFENASKEKENLGDSYISTSSLFLGCFDTKLNTHKVLQKHGLNYDLCLNAISIIRGSSKITEKDGESKASYLDEYTIDLTALARKGLLDPVIGRDLEIRRAIEILSRRKKNNPIIIGEPGVGKTVIVEGLAQQIVNGDAPEYLLKRKVLSLEIGTLLAGAKMQGEFEERLKSIKDEIIAASGEIILFIDEIHTVVGAGRTGGVLDASNMLKPALAKGLLQCIGSTTLKEYKKFIETDKALERRFQIVKIEEPSTDQAKQILRGLQKKYEDHHHIQYSDEAIESAVILSNRYIQDRFLPDKAIDLMDEAGASKRMKVIYIPPEIRELENERVSLENQKMQAFNEQDFENMAQFQMKIAVISAKLRAHRKEFEKKQNKNERIVNSEDIAKIISKKTSIPVQKMIASEAKKLSNLEKVFSKKIIGQEHAITAISNAIRRNRSGLRKPESPIASFIFLGPTGVGKTELAKVIAEEVLDDASKIIRVDMSEYMEKHSVSKFIGAPPGYVGFGEGGFLTEKVKRNPYSVILLDEFEKAHPEIYNILLPVLDEGWLTDSEGQRVSFRNCIIIGTSNIGSSFLSEDKKPLGINTKDIRISNEDQKKQIISEVKKYLRPEFINRLDEIVIFNKLSLSELKKILYLQIEDLKKRLDEKNYNLKISNKVLNYILEHSDSSQYGARPLKRLLDTLIESKIASIIIEQKKKIEDRLTIKVDIKNSNIQIKII